MALLLPTPRHTALAYILLIGSFLFATFANAKGSDQTTSSGCSSSDISTEQCINYARGYLNALQQLSNIDLSSNFSTFESRAFKTRVGNSNLPDILQKELNLCLPKEISASEMLASIDLSLPLEKTMLKALQAKYPC